MLACKLWSTWVTDFAGRVFLDITFFAKLTLAMKPILCNVPWASSVYELWSKQPLQSLCNAKLVGGSGKYYRISSSRFKKIHDTKSWDCMSQMELYCHICAVFCLYVYLEGF